MEQKGRLGVAGKGKIIMNQHDGVKATLSRNGCFDDLPHGGIGPEKGSGMYKL
jgi:hypothetical protein